MRAPLRAASVAFVAAVSLYAAGSAFGANIATVAVSHAGTATTIHVAVPPTTDPVAAIAIFVPTGYTLNLTQAANTNIGKVDATANGHDVGLTLPLTGLVTTDSPAAHTSDVCAPTTHAAVWNLNLSVAGSSIVLPLYVDPTAGAATALGAYEMLICLPPWDVPVGTPGRSFEGAQLLDAEFTVNGVFTPPTSGGLLVWHTLVTPYNPGQGTPNAAGTFEARSLVGVPSLSLKASKKKGKYTLSGTAAEGGVPVAGATVADPARRVGEEARQGGQRDDGRDRHVVGVRQADRQEAGLLQGDRHDEGAGRDRPGLRDAATGDRRPRRLQQRDARRVDRVEPGGEAQAVTDPRGSGLGLAFEA